MLYKNMTEEAQLKWVNDFSTFCNEGMVLLENTGAWDSECTKVMEQGLQLITAFDFTLRFVSRTIAMGDYSCRVNRLRHYIEQIKEEISAGSTVLGADGKKYSFIPALQQQRRRGRPSKDHQSEQPSSVATEKEQKIASLVGQDIITATPQREKNNDELAQERAAIEAEQAKSQPSLFAPVPEVSPSGSIASVSEVSASDSTTTVPEASPSGSFATVPEVSASGVSDRKHLHELRFLMSDSLASDVDQIRILRAQAASAAEHAKALAEQNAKASDIMPYAQQAADYTEQYENIYGRVDAEMAEVYVRLQEDEKFKTEWSAKADIKALRKMLRPYYERMTDDFLDKVKAKIANEQPEVQAAKAQAQADKKEVAAIRKYLLRTDKPNTAKRIKGMEEKYHRLVELIGEEEAKAYLPVIAKAKEDLKKSVNSNL